MLTNIPTRSSRTCSARPPTGVPIAMSGEALSRANRTASTACITMNGVAL